MYRNRIQGGQAAATRSGVLSLGFLNAYNNVVLAGQNSNVPNYGFRITGGVATLRNNTVWVDARSSEVSYAVFVDGTASATVYSRRAAAGFSSAM